MSGLTAAWNLARKNKKIKVVLLEASQRVGGWVRSTKTRQGGIFELGPRGLVFSTAGGKTTLSMVRERDSKLCTDCVLNFSTKFLIALALIEFAFAVIN